MKLVRSAKDAARIRLRDDDDLRQWVGYFDCTAKQLINSVNLVGFQVRNVQRHLDNECLPPKCLHCGNLGGRAVVTQTATEAEGERVYLLAYVWRCLGCQKEWIDHRPSLCPLVLVSRIHEPAGRGALDT